MNPKASFWQHLPLLLWCSLRRPFKARAAATGTTNFHGWILDTIPTAHTGILARVSSTIITKKPLSKCTVNLAPTWVSPRCERIESSGDWIGRFTLMHLLHLFLHAHSCVWLCMHGLIGAPLLHALILYVTWVDGMIMTHFASSDEWTHPPVCCMSSGYIIFGMHGVSLHPVSRGRGIDDGTAWCMSPRHAGMTNNAVWLLLILALLHASRLQTR